MSQEISLADLPVSPIELDERERVFEAEGQWVEWVRFTREIVQSVTDRTRMAMWVRLARKFEKIADQLEPRQASLASDLSLLAAKIWQRELERVDLSMKLYTKAYHFDPSSIEALRGARKIYEQRGEWELALQLCTFEQELIQDEHEKAKLFLHMAEICSKQLNLRDDAVRCVKEATKLIPGFQPAAHYDQIIREVEDDQRQRFEAFLAEAEASKTPRQRARRFHEAAEVLMGIDPQDPEIETLLMRSLEIEQRNDKARLSLQTFYQLNERWASLTAFLIERLETTQRRSDRLEILKELARLSEQALDDNEDSVRWHREVLNLDPVDDQSINFCTQYYHQRQQWLDLVNVYESALKMRRRGQDEGEMLFQIAMILWKKISSYVEAEKYFKRIKLNDPRHPLMLKFYIDFYTQQEDWRRLLTVLSTQ
jgi:tetratricopeptide (TPR) repeat protein